MTYLYLTLLSAIAVYAVIGATVATIFMQTPYAENGWIIIALLWPLFLFGGGR